jgi:hypothetical protein
MEQDDGQQHRTGSTAVGTQSVMEHLNWECIQAGMVALMFASSGLVDQQHLPQARTGTTTERR